MALKCALICRLVPCFSCTRIPWGHVHGTHVCMRQWYSLCVYQLELQRAYKDINPARPTIELLGSVPVRATLQRNLSAFSATVVSCVRSDQPPSQVPRHTTFCKIGGRLAAIQNYVFFQVRRLEPCLHTPVKLPAPGIDSRGPKFRPCGSRVNCQ
jgi:hypothetical protein